jgi:hypothetical protein
MRAAERGLVAVRSTGGVVLLHSAEPGYGETTVCGRYDRDRYLPENEDLPDDTRECQVCAGTVALRRRGQRDGAVPAPEQRRQRQEAFERWATRTHREPVDRELFERTAPAWNCVSDPDGPHYLASDGTCQWCGAPRDRWSEVGNPAEGRCGECGSLPDAETGGWA